MTGQIDFFDLIEKQNEQEIKSCIGCANCNQTQNYKNYIDKDGVAHFMAFCNPTRQVITEHTGSWLCHNKLYERRTK